MKKIWIVLMIIMVSGLAVAQNTQTQPLEGGATNPVTPQEVPGTNQDKTLSDILKKKSKTKTTVAPIPSNPSAPGPIVPSDPNKTNIPVTK